MKAEISFVLFLAFTDIVFGKLFLVETEDKEPVENGSGEEDPTSYEYGEEDIVPSTDFPESHDADPLDALDANLFNRLKHAATPKKGNKSSSKKKATPTTKKKGSGEDVRIKILI